jgi:hypothetical protein
MSHFPAPLVPSTFSAQRQKRQKKEQNPQIPSIQSAVMRLEIEDNAMNLGDSVLPKESQ